ncbi:MAG: hypothetical protein GF344_00945 [Chitinivibrionales bacterium]|nr:hypothetical protein [Chitinivibrionales bacterium]MBD3355673.1 hypothetical protein [Chitinivibrionales bacterium]
MPIEFTLSRTDKADSIGYFGYMLDLRIKNTKAIPIFGEITIATNHDSLPETRVNGIVEGPAKH